jgi:hypothetical protein
LTNQNSKNLNCATKTPKTKVIEWSIAATFVKVNICADELFDGERAPKFQFFSTDFTVHEGFNPVFG